MRQILETVQQGGDADASTTLRYLCSRLLHKCSEASDFRATSSLECVGRRTLPWHGRGRGVSTKSTNPH